MLNGIWPHLYPAGDEAEFIREKVEQCVLMMVVGMVSLGGSLGVVLMYIAYVSFNAGNSQSPGLQRGNENLSARSMVRPWQKCMEAKFYKCSAQLGSWPKPGDESWFFLKTRFGPGCFEWDPEKQCVWDSPAHFKKLEHCRRHCHRVPPERRCLKPVIRLPALVNCTRLAPKEHRAASRSLWFYDPLRHRCQRWTGVCVFRAFRTFEDCFKRCLAT
ncbi:uncharacterized protein [Dermacentor albipictus]|uniref:uncharacterized protein isoform X2 n=1 Tax=Dermacentor albipictus TaxID=60249 RepID=UPI0031FCDC58